MNKTKKRFEWNKKTPISKYHEIILFITLPILCFILGLKINLNRLYSLSDWDSFTINEMNISVPYPSSWKLSTITTWDGKATNSGMSYELTATGSKGEISVVWGNGDHGGGCPEELREEHIILDIKKSICRYTDNRGEIFAFSLPEKNKWWGQVAVTMQPGNKNNASFFQNFISRITYINI